MRALEPAELECLRRVARDAVAFADPCPAEMIERLARLGLVEKVSTLRLPLEWVHTRYRLSRAGEDALAGR